MLTRPNMKMPRLLRNVPTGVVGIRSGIRQTPRGFSTRESLRLSRLIQIDWWEVRGKGESERERNREKKRMSRMSAVDTSERERERE